MPELCVRRKFAAPVDPGAVAADWRARGYSCDEFVDPPGQQWNGFVHATDELVTVVAGRVELEVGDAAVIAEPGDEVFIPRRVIHSVRNKSSGVSRWLYGYSR